MMLLLSRNIYSEVWGQNLQWIVAWKWDRVSFTIKLLEEKSFAEGALYPYTLMGSKNQRSAGALMLSQLSIDFLDMPKGTALSEQW